MSTHPPPGVGNCCPHLARKCEFIEGETIVQTGDPRARSTCHTPCHSVVKPHENSDLSYRIFSMAARNAAGRGEGNSSGRGGKMTVCCKAHLGSTGGATNFLNGLFGEYKKEPNLLWEAYFPPGGEGR